MSAKRGSLPAPFADDVLEVQWYQQAQRVADTLGQDAATAMLQRERSRRMLARIDAAHAALQARRGVTWQRWLAIRFWHALVASCAVAAFHALATLGYPAGTVASLDVVAWVGALAFTLVSPAA